MKKVVYFFMALTLTITSAATFAQAANWKISDSYSVKFLGLNDKSDPSGEFRGLTGAISFDEANLAASKFNVTIDVASINTGNGMKNTHAKSAKWFDAEKYPTISFVSSAITKTANGYEAKGTLTMHGVSKPITMPFTFSGNVFKSSFELNRLDYQVNTEEPDHGAAKFKLDITVPVTK